MEVNRSPPSQESGRKHRRAILTGTSCTGTSIITRSCHQSLVGRGCSSGWMRRMITATHKGTRSYIELSRVTRTRAASTLASTRSPSSKVLRKKSGVSCPTGYSSLIPVSRLITDSIFLAQTKTIWLRFFGYTLHANRSLARIALRASLGEEPTEAQIMAKMELIKPRNIRRALAEQLQNDIRKAFNRGEEV